MRKRIRPLFFISLCLVFSACSNIKYLPAGQNLYTGATVRINPDSTGKITDEKNVKGVLESKTRPRPNTSFLGLRIKLYIYNLAGQPKKSKGIRHWLRNKVGEPPVLQSQVKIPYNNAVLASYLISQGYLQAKVTGDTVVKNRTAKAIYTAETGDRYTINKITFPKDSVGIASIINSTSGQSLLKVGNFYDFDVFKAERERIDNDLKQNGYFYFNPDYLLLQVDSAIGKHRVNIYVKVKEITPNAALKPYTIKDITIYPNYSLRGDSSIRASKPVLYKDFIIKDPRNTFKLGVFDRLVFFQKGELYNRRDHNQSLNRMVNIGTFKVVKADFLTDSAKSNQLDVNFYLTPLKKNSLSFQVIGTSKSNNFVGSEVKLTQTTRNVFRGAEKLEISASGGFEKQIRGSDQTQGNSYSITGQAKLIFPRFLLPFFKFNSTNAFIPKTNILASYQILDRVDYTLNAIKAEFGYDWKESIYKEHVFNPISINYVRSKVVDSATLFAKNPSLRTSLENQFIVGLNYNFTYNDQVNQNKRNNIYFSGDLETSGSLVGLFAPKNDKGQKSLFGTALSQFLRLEGDLRNYYKVNKTVIWANRLNVGFGYAYGNNKALPFVRQFFAGGSSDIRAFGSRLVGPGTYIIPDSLTFRDQGGDIKIMLNTELRFKLVSMLYGAAFIDAGNIWLRKEDPLRPGGKFKANKFIEQMAIGTGAGLRVDASFFVIRLDVAFPIRRPDLPNGPAWVMKDIAFGSSTWRKQNLTYNLGIGYPF
ncbi:translocation and assembly module lipoprotein TamL [Pedobacter gandavensis]|uniref:BamA/TamA family outer membrane protein n=1 Tax=Pedobacter gandavensis TaxID=2679963 RepID=A0ABR6F2T7_9SPHI|nr:BamA/TamA family outer membrane protein [Pedobacter gandavensis]MBB2151751.1 BamA/TamA family outer membrane protein [Pedobacter gandavensis]